MKHVASAVLALGLTVASGPVRASVISDHFSGLLFFGDSLTDPGNYLFLPPSPYFESQFSNGPVYSTILDDDLPSSSVGNYAFGGARAQDGAAPDFNEQIDLFSVDLSLPAFLSPVSPGTNPLASVWFGANDMFSVIDNLGAGLVAKDVVAESAAASAISVASSAVGDGIRRLFNGFGITDFVVMNLPDLGATPRYNSDAALAAEARDLSINFNLALNSELGGIGGASITKVDVFSLFDDIVAGTLLPDLSNISESCLDPAPTVEFILANPLGLPVTECGDPDSYLFWDAVHPTAVAHAELARQIDAALAPVPLPAGAVLLLTGVGVLAFARRRAAA